MQVTVAFTSLTGTLCLGLGGGKRGIFVVNYQVLGTFL